MAVPQLTKQVHAFLTREDGKISKKTLLTAGTIAATIAAAHSVAAHSSSVTADCPGVTTTANAAVHANSLSLSNDQQELVGTHNHCIESHTSSGCCFAAGTHIATPEGVRTIEHFTVGDSLLSYNMETHLVEKDTVTEIISPVRDGVYLLNGTLRITNDHPLYTRKKEGGVAWAAIDRAAAQKSYALPGLQALGIGDSIYHKDNRWVRIESMSYLKGSTLTYTLKVKKNKNYFAEGLLAHNPMGGGC